MKSILAGLLSAVAVAQQCRNPKYDILFPPPYSETKEWITNENPIMCDFVDCKPLFLNRASCNRIGVAYHPSMADYNGDDFHFVNGPSMHRSEFVSRVYNKVLKQFAARNMDVENIGSLDAATAVKLQHAGHSFQRGDVLVYIANDYGLTISRVCDVLMERGIIILPVYVGRYASLSQLSHMAETQFTGEIANALGNVGGFRNGNAGLILSGHDVPLGVSGTTASERHNAIVMFSRVMAQCPGSCVTACRMREQYSKTVEFPPATEKGPSGGCGPQGIIGAMGQAGPNCGFNGAPGPAGKAGVHGNRGPQGPPGMPGLCIDQKLLDGPKGRPGAPGRSGVAGLDGAPGQPGNPGARGSPGPRGSKGPIGNVGGQGSAGPPGDRGSRGPAGAQGTPGKRGADGVGMLTTGHEEAQQALFDRALLEILNEDIFGSQKIWRRVWELHRPLQKYQLEMTNCAATEGGRT